MAGTTPIYELPYPTGEDRFCDGYLYIQQLAEAVDLLLTEFDEGAAAAALVPAARLRLTTHDDAVFSPISFQIVEFDTANLANLSLSAQYLTLTGGYWVQGFAIGMDSSGVAGNGYYATTGTQVAIQGRDNGSSTDTHFGSSGMGTHSDGDLQALEAGPAGSSVTNFEVTGATMFAFRVGDN